MTRSIAARACSGTSAIDDEAATVASSKVAKMTLGAFGEKSSENSCVLGHMFVYLRSGKTSKQWRPLSNLVGRTLQNLFTLLDISADRDLFSKGCALANIDPMSMSLNQHSRMNKPVGDSTVKRRCNAEITLCLLGRT